MYDVCMLKQHVHICSPYKSSWELILFVIWPCAGPGVKRIGPSNVSLHKRWQNCAQNPDWGLGHSAHRLWVVCPRWWNRVPLACYMLGSLGHIENLTTNYSGPRCWERCHVPRTLKNPSMVFYHCTQPQKAKLPDPTHLSLDFIILVFHVHCLNITAILLLEH